MEKQRKLEEHLRVKKVRKSGQTNLLLDNFKKKTSVIILDQHFCTEMLQRFINL